MFSYTIYLSLRVAILNNDKHDAMQMTPIRYIVFKSRICADLNPCKFRTWVYLFSEKKGLLEFSHALPVNVDEVFEQQRRFDNWGPGKRLGLTKTRTPPRNKLDKICIFDK